MKAFNSVFYKEFDAYSEDTESKYGALYQAMKNRFFFWDNDFGRALSRKKRFVSNYLLDYASISFTDENEVLRPFKSRDVVLRVANRDSSTFSIPLFEAADSAAQLTSRMSEDTSNENLYNYYSINVPEARRMYNSKFTKLMKNDFTYALADFMDDITVQMLSKGCNFFNQRILQKAKFYEKHKAELLLNGLADGTAYTRFDAYSEFEDNKLVEKFKLSYVPYHQLIDDGRYFYDLNFDLEESLFVMQLHNWDRDTAYRNLRQFAGKKDVDSGLSLVDSNFTFEDEFNMLWEEYGIKKYQTVKIIEAFWKDYKTDTTTDFTWKRTFFTYKNGELYEIVTMDNPYPYGLPYVKYKEQLTIGTPFGYTDTMNNIDIDNARNTVLSALFHQARKNSYDKVFFSNQLKNIKDTEGNYYMPYRPQTFYVSTLLTSGQSIKNFIYNEEPKPIDAQPLQLMDKVTNEVRQTFDVPYVNPNRTSRGSLALFYEQANEAFQPLFIAYARYLTELGKKIYKLQQFYQNDRDGIRMDEVKKKYASRFYSLGVDLSLADFNKLPDDPVDAGLKVILKSEEEVLKNKSLDMLLPILDRFGPEVLVNENLIQLFGLREAGYSLPQDKEKMNVLKDIQLIKEGQVKMDNLDTVVPFEQTMEGGVEITSAELMNHQLAVEVTRQYIMENKYDLARWIPDRRKTLLAYYQKNREGAEMQKQAALKETQAQAQAEKPQVPQEMPQEQVQQELPENLPPEVLQQLAQQGV